MIERSYHLKDDLAIQQVVTALGQAPGIYFACVIGPDAKMMAHSQPLNVGQIYRRADSPVATHPLAEGQKRWGTFVISASEKAQWRAWWREMALWGLGGVLLWLAWMARLLVWRRRVTEQEHRIADLMTMAEEQKQQARRDADKQSQSRALSAGWLQSAVDQLPGAMILLDERQRTAAVNSTAAGLLNGGGEAILPGTPWSDVPFLRTCGAALERSLRSPGAEVKVDLPTDGTILGLTTLKDGAGTWVALFPSKRVVK